jgi:glycosyltransferase involved in cell wall biosynthesis
LGIFEPELLIEYEALLSKPNLPISIFPIPFEGIKVISPRKIMNSVAILGHQRRSKSMHVGDLIKGLVDLDFNVNFNDSSEKIKINNTIADKIKSYGYVEDLSEIITQSDAVILPYDKDFYRYNGSGVAWQSISSGVPLVAPAGTSISRMLSIYNNGVLFYNNSSESILNAVVEMKAKYDSISHHSYEAMIKWRAINSIDNFIELIENFKNKI